MDISFATTNKGKIQSLQCDFEGVPVTIVPVDMDIPEIRSDETSEIAIKKAEYAFGHIKKPCIALDGGFYIPVLGGFPKAYVNFAVDTIGIEGILKLIEGKDRTCEFRDSLAYIDETLSEPVLFEAHIKGMLAEEPRGELQAHNWGELHKVFIPNDQTKTLAEMNVDEMANWRKGEYHNSCGRTFAKWIEAERL
ncbi:MAG: non-canonical purine NTP pyrophosphatase [Candidatus Uhrbacteria bacterium]|nr:non-canonical purine NTP pyrophosphatase [Candidatus Uhrbacteria bacterium]